MITVWVKSDPVGVSRQYESFKPHLEYALFRKGYKTVRLPWHNILEIEETIDQ